MSLNWAISPATQRETHAPSYAVQLVAILATLAFAAGAADAAPKFNAGSRGSRTFTGGPILRDLSPNQPRANFGGFRGWTAFASAAPIEIKPADFDAFERSLGEIQTPYGAENLAALRLRMTPEMLSYYSEELAKNASHGVVNQLSDVKLLQGDLAEAWREGDDEYATVAMRYSVVDCTLDRASGRVVEGNDHLQETTELWTFRRVSSGNWLLSAIQQT
jgi:hypothetical protein